MFKNSLRVSTTLRMSVLCAVIFAQNILPSELSSPFIVLLGLSIMSLGKIQRSYLKLVWPLLVVLVIGLMGIFGHESIHILRDIAYALTPIALIFMGYWIAGNRDTWPLILKVMVFCGFVLAVIHLARFVLNPELLTADLVEVRTSAGGGGILVVVSLILGLLQYRLGIGNLFPRLLPRFIALPVLSASFVLSYSRTEFMVGFILSLALWGLLSRVNLRFVLTIIAVVLGFITLNLVTPKDGDLTFSGKLANSLTEVAISNYQGAQDINDHWRGFESYRAVETYLSGNVLQLVVGQGFGALADLGFYMPLDGEDFRYIPVFHNGYAYILLKTGLLGLALYLFFYISVIRYAMRYSNSLNNEQKFLARLMLGCVLSLVLTMFVVGGMAEMHDAELVLLLGYLVRRLWLFKI